MDATGCSVGGCGPGGDGPTVLRRAQRLRRLFAGVVFIALAIPCLFSSPWLWPIAAIAAWFGVSHLVAAATAYGGCPELGAIPSLIVGRTVKTACGPWRWIDGKMDRGANHK